MKTIFAIIGSASEHSSNHQIVRHLQHKLNPEINLVLFDRLKELPHFDPEESTSQPPIEIIALRQVIQDADLVLISSPEYIFSVPSGLKNLFEWCAATTIFTDKPVSIITASAQGETGHAELQRIMQGLGAPLDPRKNLLIQGVKGKLDAVGNIWDEKLDQELDALAEQLKKS
ncbi:NADPH-dependent FMN reductase [Sphingobacterium prati]|uniref:NADPH-dependent FMN reductase n=1 Tax=Sphingobacterium prati TaxID=2737006 RepID=UPI0015580D80|nr:NAD(P)H-dependent oxidoreductase [Sphingobacterium prati]NPE48426.1 NAD(P)H-dependent oxidoreductase [Sphingobacterium prati]